MATVTHFFPGNQYPASYSTIDWAPDFNPALGDLLDGTTYDLIGTPTSTQRLYQLSNGLKVKLIGTGFTVDSNGDASGGTVTGFQVLQNNGTTLVQSVTGLNRPFELLSDFASLESGWDLARWLLNSSDVVSGSAGHDDMNGFGGNDTLNGNGGDDFMVGGAGKDTYNGGSGYDQIAFDVEYYDPGTVRGVSINAQTHTAIDNWGNSETFTSIESFRGSMFADSLLGSAAAEQFMGLGGRDVIDGAGGIDEVRYHRDDRRPGGAHAVIVNLTTGIAIDGFGKQDTLRNIENARGTAFGDSLTGSAVANRLRADGGNDKLNGLAGNDTLLGGEGNDIFLFTTAPNAASNKDTIEDFANASGNNDGFQLDNAVFAKLGAAGALNAGFFRAGTAAVDASDYLVYNKTTGGLAYDADGNGAGAAIQFALLSSKPTLTAADFVVI
jgi:serralysin